MVGIAKVGTVCYLVAIYPRWIHPLVRVWEVDVPSLWVLVLSSNEIVDVGRVLLVSPNL